MDTLIEEVLKTHFPDSPASSMDIARFEQERGWRLDDELRTFYSACNGARLFRKVGAPYRILPLDQIVRARVAIRGSDDDRYGPASLYVVCDMQDMDYVALNVAEAQEGRFPLFDCFHETFPEHDVSLIAPCFSGFLRQALRSEGRAYWLVPGWSRATGTEPR